MKLYGLTGGVGMGKSTADRLIRERGVNVVDTDLLARALVEPGQPALGEIRAVFGGEILDGGGRLRRDVLASRVFKDDDARKQLENILHPRIRLLWQRQVEAWRTEGHPRAVVVIPLLYETDAASLFDVVVCVACSAATQRQRLLARGWDDEQITRRLDAQWPVQKKMELANHVIWTKGNLETHARQLERIFP